MNFPERRITQWNPTRQALRPSSLEIIVWDFVECSRRVSLFDPEPFKQKTPVILSIHRWIPENGLHHNNILFRTKEPFYKYLIQIFYSREYLTTARQSKDERAVFSCSKFE